ncbi:hypothetical protein BDV37DRAFT_281006 [Aspergillus pseudonomiae]|uniref:Uncharacterized protein n=1 Tax=Aspergillus pseudonomiae TaxID=1506151 RepID=A0A5N7DJ05_9EURO|nr:uncharacterized protein BDV37DRAFT_281006 [Aspergillus pseudonomiae]KAE8406417.1 hypothetical protein BDV37DRAFT_281006 [Aspergillus pseudonomiae]
MKFSAVLLALFAGAVMAAPVPDNSIHERGSPLPSTPLAERGLLLKKPIAERGKADYHGSIAERGVPLPGTPIKERGYKLKKPIAERGEAAYGGPITERGVQLSSDLDLTNIGLVFREDHE